MHGEVELYTEFEGNDFVIERLNPGSIINHDQFLMGDLSQVNLRASKSTHILEFSTSLYESLMDDFPELKKRLMLYQNKLLRQKSKHLNYIEALPQDVHKEAFNTIRRENILKNVVFIRILEIREEKRKPKLSQVL